MQRTLVCRLANLGALGQQHMAGWMCLNKYAKFATFVRAEAAADFFFFLLVFLFLLPLLLALTLPEAQDLFFRHFVDISARPKREGQWVVCGSLGGLGDWSVLAGH